MPGRRTIAVFGIIATIIVAISIAGYIYLHNPQKQNVIDSNLMTGVIYPVLEITVLDQNNNTVYRYVKVGDPPTKNFLLWIYHTYWYSAGASKELIYPSWTAEDGLSLTPNSGSVHGAYETSVGGFTYVSLKIAIGTGTTAPTIDDYRLANKIAEFPVIRYEFVYNSTHMWIHLRGVYTAPSTLSVSFQEVGLFGYMDLGGGSRRWFLLFRDVLPSSITLGPGNSIVIAYNIYVRYA